MKKGYKKTSVYYVSYVATWKKLVPDPKGRRSRVIQTETAIRSMVMKNEFNAIDVKNKAIDDLDVDELLSFMIISITEFDSEEEYSKFFSRPIHHGDRKGSIN